MGGYRYGPYHDGPDPLEPPYDVRGAVDALGESVLDGSDPASALRDLLRRGMPDHQGLDDLLRRVRERQRELRDRGRHCAQQRFAHLQYRSDGHAPARIASSRAVGALR